ncbi:D-TA family PLP-dependent enzyme [Rhodospirillum sp. A1_3_36]|uniref:D-TA family PLP-dependent enzyme n=1 Tax=Rhodospirillum sp. A1_3_36 TaxID=3391666 RepID=UPI0039A57635
METPRLVVDMDVVDRNIARFQALAEKVGVKTRPHIKTHKLPFLAHRQIAAGAIGITCQKIGEAEVMADAGLDDILITYNILGQEKLDRLAALARRIRLSVTCDNAPVAQALSERFSGEDKPLRVLIECDTGAGRCGVQSPVEAHDLARTIAHLPGLTLEGLMTYPPMAASADAEIWLAQARRLLTESGLSCPVVSNGGTPNLGDLGLFKTATEHRAGTYIYNDRSLVTGGHCTVADCAAVVHATVISRPTDRRAIIDAGSKALSSDLLGLKGFGLIREAPDADIVGLSEEHGTIDLTNTSWRPRVGDIITIIPNHVCVVSNLFDAITLRHPDGRLEEVRVSARGKVA